MGMNFAGLMSFSLVFLGLDDAQGSLDRDIWLSPYSLEAVIHAIDLRCYFGAGHAPVTRKEGRDKLKKHTMNRACLF